MEGGQMIQPPPELRDTLSRIEDLEVFGISIISLVASVLVVLTMTLWRLDATLRELVRILRPGTKATMTRAQAEELTKRAL